MQPELDCRSLAKGKLFDGAVVHVLDALLNSVIVEFVDEIAMDQCFDQLSPMSESSVDKSPTLVSRTPAVEHTPAEPSSSSPGRGAHLDPLLEMVHSALAAPCGPPTVVPSTAPAMPLVYTTPPPAGSRHIGFNG